MIIYSNGHIQKSSKKRKQVQLLYTPCASIMQFLIKLILDRTYVKRKMEIYKQHKISMEYLQNESSYINEVNYVIIK